MKFKNFFAVWKKISNQHCLKKGGRNCLFRQTSSFHKNDTTLCSKDSYNGFKTRIRNEQNKYNIINLANLLGKGFYQEIHPRFVFKTRLHVCRIDCRILSIFSLRAALACLLPLANACSQIKWYEGIHTYFHHSNNRDHLHKKFPFDDLPTGNLLHLWFGLHFRVSF